MFVGMKMFLMGLPGSGKTHSLRTLKPFAEKGLKVCSLFLEGNYTVLGHDLDWMHWKFIKPPNSSMKGFAEIARKVHNNTAESLSKMSTGLDREKQTHFIQMMEFLDDFKDEKGVSLGSINTWGPNHVLVIDNLTIVSDHSKTNTVGAKPGPTQPEWGIMMDMVKQFVMQLSTLDCHVIFLSHIEQEPDILTGALKTNLSTLGQKLAPKLPAYFSDCILAIKEGRNFSWDTEAANSTVKAIHLPIAAKQKPDFAIPFDIWLDKGGKFVG